MVIGILYFGEGTLAIGYLLFCTVASLGVLQVVASRARLVGLSILPAPFAGWLGAALVVLAYGGFFYLQPDLFIPGLAGGELFILCLAGFVFALLLTLGLGVLSARLFERKRIRAPVRREEITLPGQQEAELWLPAGTAPPVLLALRETTRDSLDVLCGELVASGAAALLCDEANAEAAAAWLDEHRERFHPSRRHVIGVGRGADRALQLAAGGRFQSAIALAPFGGAFHARPGLRWLRETDYLTALRATRRRPDVPPVTGPVAARIICADEDLLIRPQAAREMFPGVILVAGARHMTLATMPAVVRLAQDFLQLHPQPRARAAAGAVVPASGEVSE